jgi:hypothetical protein
MIVRIKRGSQVLGQLVGETTRQHRTVSVMGCRPGTVLQMADDAQDSSERASNRCAILDSCANAVVEGFFV